MPSSPWWALEKLWQDSPPRPSGSGEVGASGWPGYSEAARQLAQELRFNPLFMSEVELARHNGTRADGLLLLALKSRAHEHAIILDVSAGADYYAPGQAYHALTGRDCSRALSLTSLAPEHVHADMRGASESEWDVLDAWAAKLSSKYPTVGILTPSVPCTAKALGAQDLDIESDEWRMVG